MESGSGDAPTHPTAPSRRREAIAWGLVVLAVLATVRLFAPDDFDRSDQAKQGLAIVDAYANGRWLLPLEMARYYPTKPPLYTWLATIVCHAAGGTSELAARAPSLAAAVALLLTTIAIARRLSPRAALASGVALVSCFHTVRLATLARTDMLTTAFTALAQLALLSAYEDDRAEPRRPGARLKILVAFTAAGLGTLAKSPAALALLCLVTVAWLALRRDLRWARERALDLGLGALVAAAIVAAWFVPAAVRGGDEFLDVIVGRELGGHLMASGEMADKGQPWYYPVPHLVSKFLPWSILLPIALADAVRARREGEPHESGRAALDLVLAGFCATLAFFMIPAVKRADHVLPAYPWAALLVGSLLDRHCAPAAAGGAARATRGTLVAIGAAMVLAGPLLAVALAARPAVVLVSAAALVAGGALVVLGAARGGVRRVLAGSALGLGLATTLVYYHAISDAYRERKGAVLPPFCAAVRARIGSGPLVIHRVTPSTLFYLGRSQFPVIEEEEAGKALDGGIPVVCSADAAESLGRRHGARRALESEVYFFQGVPYRVVLLEPLANR